MAQETLDSAGTSICGNCNDFTEVFITDFGLRCESCYGEPEDEYPTYTPEIRDYEDTRGKEMAENAEEFKENLPDVGFDVEMQDGSTWETDKFTAHAVFMKYGEQWEQFLPALASRVAEHYEKETEPTKFVSHADWGASGHDDSQDHYDTHAELAPVVAYPDIRAAQMQLGLMALSGDDEDAVNVLTIGDGEISQYGEHGRITVDFDENADMDFELEDGGDDE